MEQDKEQEKRFFNKFAQRHAEYDVFSKASNRRIVDAFIEAGNLLEGALVIDMGCGSGAFTGLLQQRGHKCIGLDLAEGLLRVGRERFPEAGFVAGDVEALPFPADSLSGVLLSGLIHHLPNPSQCAQEVFRVLKPGGHFFAFDPNRLNPFMYLYRDRSSPLYSAKGVTENERPIIAKQVAQVFRGAGFFVKTNYISGLQYNYVASSFAQRLLPIYNIIDGILFRPKYMRPLSSFVLTSGRKP